MSCVRPLTPRRNPVDTPSNFRKRTRSNTTRPLAESLHDRNGSGTRDKWDVSVDVSPAGGGGRDTVAGARRGEWLEVSAHTVPTADSPEGDGTLFERMSAAGAVDCLQADASRCGGITEWLRVAAVAAAHHLELSGHCAPHLHVHAAAAVPNLRHLEWFHDHVRIEDMFLRRDPRPDRRSPAPRSRRCRATASPSATTSCAATRSARPPDARPRCRLCPVIPRATRRVPRPVRRCSTWSSRGTRGARPPSRRPRRRR